MRSEPDFGGKSAFGLEAVGYATHRRRYGGAVPDESLEITRDQIEAAADRIAPYIRRTPVLDVGLQQTPVILKLDCLQVSGSFKARGAFSAVTMLGPGGRGVTTASGGNFGSAVALAAATLGRSATIFVPQTSPEAKIQRLRDYGAAVEVIDGFYPEALAACVEWADGHDVELLHAFDQRDVVAGQGTCGLEVLEQVPDCDTILVAVGGGGLIGGLASWVRAEARIVAVETEGTATLHDSLAAGERVSVEISGIAASSLGARQVGALGWDAARRWVDSAVLVTDDDVLRAQAWLWDSVRLGIEPGAAAPMAALLSGVYRPSRGERVVAVTCGANLDPASIPPAR
jgi:threonine dehydratase